MDWRTEFTKKIAFIQSQASPEKMNEYIWKETFKDVLG
jgi:hypothetical protein